MVATITPGDSLVAYERIVGGKTRTFEAANDAHPRAGGSRWRRATGRAVDGHHDGTRLAQANVVSPLFFFAWKDFAGETDVFKAE